MPFQPGFAPLAAAMADPAREAMLVALASGRALPAGELAGIAGTSPQSASRHLGRMVESGLLRVWPQGRHRYYRIADGEVAGLIETMCAVATRIAVQASERGRRAPQGLREARRCYDHLAGRLGVQLADALIARGFVAASGREAAMTPAGARWFAARAVPIGDDRLRLCLDGTERRPHLAGPAATALLRFLEERKLLAGDPTERRALRLTRAGRAWFAELGIEAASTAEA